MKTKKKPPLKQLKAAAKHANDIAKKRGLIAKESLIDKIASNPDAPTLPGLPGYLPHEETITACQVLLARTAKAWIDETRDNETKTENISEFFKFVLKRIDTELHKFEKEQKEMEKNIKEDFGTYTLAEIFSPLRRLQTAKALHKFFVDSFAVSVIVKMNSSTSEYVDWFLNNWTVEMLKLWKIHEKDNNTTTS
jgi:hypothetical protein